MSSYLGELVRLRAPEPEDIDVIYDWVNDPEVTYNLGTRYPQSKAALRERMEKWAKARYDMAAFIVVARADDRPIGQVTLRNATPEVRDAELDMFIGDRTLWGRGYGTDAMRTLVRAGFEQLNLNRIHLWVYARNTAAIRVYEKVGFVKEVLALESWYKDGEYLDAHLMGILRREWGGS